jgi:hypothetical protein
VSLLKRLEVVVVAVVQVCIRSLRIGRSGSIIETNSLQHKRGTDTSESDEVGIAGGLHWDVNEQLVATRELSDLDEVQATVDFEAVTAVSVAAFFYEFAKRRRL